jgi:hypothetical protein
MKHVLIDFDKTIIPVATPDSLGRPEVIEYAGRFFVLVAGFEYKAVTPVDATLRAVPVSLDKRVNP